MGDFESDGCTGWFDFDYVSCCIDHDFADYSGVSDWVADIELAECVASLGWPIMAVVMLVGVKIFRPIYRLKKKLFDQNK